MVAGLGLQKGQGVVSVQIGTEEGDACNRDGCTGVLENLPDKSMDGGCSCHRSPPCGYCTSTMPECPECGWRLEE